MNKFQCIPALNLYNKLFRHTTPMVLKWSASNEEFEVQGKTHWSYWRWCFNTFIVAGLIGFGSCIDVIAHKEEAGISLVVLSCGFASLSFLLWACAAVLIWKKHEIVTGIVFLKNVLKYLERLPVRGKPWNRTGTTWRMTSYAIQLAVVTLAIISVTLYPLCFWVGMDPFRYTFSKIISARRICGLASNSTCILVVHYIIIFFRVICATICIAEACRFFAVLFCMLIYILELIVRCTEAIRYTHLTQDCVHNNESFSKWYTALRIAHKVLYSPLCSLFALILGDGFIIILLCNIATIRAYDILPLQVYWLMPVVSILFSFFVAFALPFAIKVYKSSDEMVHARNVMLSYHRNMVTAKKRKLDKKETAASIPIAISCGGFFDLERGAESTYFNHIFGRTVDGLLVPMK